MRSSTQLSLGDAAATPAAARRGAASSIAFDVAAVLLFVVIGRRSHDEGGSWLAETGKVAASFLIALVVAWVVAWVVARAWRAPRTLRTGVIVWSLTVAVGMLLRPLFGRSVQPSFVVVTAVFLAAAMLGWRAIAGQVSSRRAR